MSRFIHAARKGENFWLLYIVVVFLVLVGFWVGAIPFQLIIAQLRDGGKVSADDLQQFNATADFTVLGLSSHIGLMLMLGSFIAAAIFLFIGVEFLHKRPFRTLINPTRNIRSGRIVFGFVAWFVLTALAELVMFGIDPGAYTFHFEWRNWVPLLAVSLLILPIQTSFEEVFARGYLLQGFGLATNSKVAAIILSSLIFASMHLMNPEIKEFGLPVMMTYYISVAIFLAVITLLDDGLELALGIHAAVNIYGASCVSYSGSALQTESLFHVDILNPMLQLVLFYVMMLIFFVVTSKRYTLNPIASLFTKVDTERNAYESTDEISDMA